MPLRSFVLLVALALSPLAACTPSEPEAPAPTGTAAALAGTATVAPAPAATPAAAGAPSPAAAGEATAEEDAEDGEEFEWDLADAPEDPTVFEIDADATSYYFPIPQRVVLKVKALNGTPPYTFRWRFGDGSPEEYGEEVVHRFNQLGQISVFVFAKDAAGQEAHMNLILLGVTPDYFYGGGGIVVPSPTPAASPAPTE